MTLSMIPGPENALYDGRHEHHGVLLHEVGDIGGFNFRSKRAAWREVRNQKFFVDRTRELGAVEAFRPDNTQDSSQPSVTIVGEEPGFRSP